MARFLEAAPGIKYKAGVECCLWSGAASLRGCLSEGLRYRFQTHDVAHRAGQGSQGSLCDAFPDAARTSARLVFPLSGHSPTRGSGRALWIVGRIERPPGRPAVLRMAASLEPPLGS